MHRHSLLMRSLLSQSQTPAAPRRAVGFFRSGCSTGCPAGLITRPTSDWLRFISATPFDRRRGATLNSCLIVCQCQLLVQFPNSSEHAGPNCKPLKPFLVIEDEDRAFLFSTARSTVLWKMDGAASETRKTS